MIGALRRSRWFAALLLALAPGAGGQLVAALHPCPADAPAAAVQAPHAHAGAGHHAGTPAPGHSHHGADCSCVGLCCAPAVVTAPMAQLDIHEIVAPVEQRSWPVIDAADRLTPLPDRLPPKTAPPLA